MSTSLTLFERKVQYSQADTQERILTLLPSFPGGPGGPGSPGGPYGTIIIYLHRKINGCEIKINKINKLKR